MKLLSQTLFLSLLPSLALANFHIDTLEDSTVSPLGNPTWKSQVACPSNKWSCSCMIGDSATGTLFNGEVGTDEFFSIKKGFCGMPQMNFYRQAGTEKDGGRYDFYINDGDGSVIGTCYPNVEHKECFLGIGGVAVLKGWVCYSYACGN